MFVIMQCTLHTKQVGRIHLTLAPFSPLAPGNPEKTGRTLQINEKDLREEEKAAGPAYQRGMNSKSPDSPTDSDS